MGRYRLRHPGVRSETEEQIRYRGLPLVGGRCARGYARSEMAQYRGLRESARRRSPTFPGAAPKCRPPGGHCVEMKRSVLTEKDSKPANLQETPAEQPKPAPQIFNMR